MGWGRHVADRLIVPLDHPILGHDDRPDRLVRDLQDIPSAFRDPSRWLRTNISGNRSGSVMDKGCRARALERSWTICVSCAACHQGPPRVSRS